MVKSLDTQGMGNITDADLTSWPHTIRKLKEIYKDARWGVPGHGAVGGTDLLDHMLSLLER